MAPIIVELQKEYEGIVSVEFIDVWKDPDAGRPYGIRMIPTQVFFDRNGKEVFRHEGFFPKEAIVKVFQEKMGVTEQPKDSSEPEPRKITTL
jgi:thioredoxin 1